MELRQLRYFVAVAETLNFHRAAERLGIAQPPLGRQVAELEAELGVRLLERSRRRVALTAAGETFLVEAKQALLQAQRAARAAREAADETTSRLVVGFATSLASGRLPSVIGQLTQENMPLRLELFEAPHEEQLAALARGRVDLAILYQPEPGKGLRAEPLWEERALVALPAGHRLAGRAEIAWLSLAPETFIIRAWEEGRIIRDCTLHCCATAGFIPTFVEHAISWDSAIVLVAGGFGITVLPESAAAPTAGVVFRPLIHPDARIALNGLYRPEKESPILRRFMSLARG